jgi:hypothetical protein
VYRAPDHEVSNEICLLRVRTADAIKCGLVLSQYFEFCRIRCILENLVGLDFTRQPNVREGSTAVGFTVEPEWFGSVERRPSSRLINILCFRR